MNFSTCFIMIHYFQRYRRRLEKQFNETAKESNGNNVDDVLRIYVNSSEAMPGKRLLTLLPAIKLDHHQRPSYVITKGNHGNLLEMIALQDGKESYLQFKSPPRKSAVIPLTISGSYKGGNTTRSTDFRFDINIRLFIVE